MIKIIFLILTTIGIVFSNSDGKSSDYSHDHKMNPPSIVTDDGGRSCGFGEWTCEDAGYILGTSAGDINLDGNLNVTDIIMYIEKILRD